MHMREIDELGGMVKAIEAGIPKLRIEESAARTQARIDGGKQIIVGVNRYPADEPTSVPVLKVDNERVRREQLAKLAELRRDATPPRWSVRSRAHACGGDGRGQPARAQHRGCAREGDGG
jgi:methylmalonyl-CoA mutase